MTNRHQPAAWAQTHDVPEQWQEQEFVDSWVKRDDGRQDERGPMIEATVNAGGFAADQSLRVLDVGAGYGLLSKSVCEKYPSAHVTLQDVSEPMFSHARERLAQYTDRTTYVNSDFSQRDWTSGLVGPFNFVVSAIAIHNMYDDDLISSIYKDIYDLMADDGVFANLDYAAQAGGVDTHIQWLKEAGFRSIEVTPQSEKAVLLRATK